MSELTDLNAAGNGLAAVSGGLQGLLEAYKMKMAQNVEQAKINQQGLDAGAQARAQVAAMQPYRDAQAAALTSDAASRASDAIVNRFKAGMSTDSSGMSPRGLAVQQVLAGKAPPSILDMKDPATLLAWNAQANGKSYNDLEMAQKQKDFENQSSTIQAQNDAKATLDNLETMKQLVPKLGLADSPGLGAGAASALAYMQSKVGGTDANKFVALSGPGQMGVAEKTAHRFSMPETTFTGPAFSLNNTHSSLTGNLSGIQDATAKASGLQGYVPRARTFDSNGNILPWTPPADAAVPGAPPAPGATPAPAAPVAPAAASPMSGPPGGGANAPAPLPDISGMTNDQINARMMVLKAQGVGGNGP